MRGKRHPSRSGIVVLLVLMWSALGVAFPLLSTLGVPDRTAGGTVAASPRDVFAITHPIALGYGLIIDGATLSYGDGQPASSKEPTAILIEGGSISFESRKAPTDPGNEAAPHVLAIAGGKFETLELKRTSFAIVMGDGRSETLTDVEARVTNRRRNGLSVQGRAKLRGVSHTIDFQIGAVTDRRLPARLPVKASIKGPLLTGSFDGRVAVGEPLHVQGTAEFSATELRRTARAFGLGLSDGAAVGGLKVQGRLDWNRTMLTFDQATFRNELGEATGTLALDLERPRPAITGTLAFKSLDLTRIGSTFQTSKEPFEWPEFATRAEPLLPIARELDVDVRLSASAVKIGSLDLGATAATLNMKNGKLLAEVADVEIAGGKGSVQVSGDVSRTAPRINWRGRLNGVDSTRIAMLLWGLPVISGAATVQYDITAEGSDAAKLMKSVGGRVGIRFDEAGRVALDLKSLFADPLPQPTEGGAGWTALSRTPTSFDTLEAALGIRNGVVSLEKVVATAGEVRYEAAGEIDKAANSMSTRVQLTRPVKDAASFQDRVRLDGSLAAPRLTREVAPARTSVSDPAGPRG